MKYSQFLQLEELLYNNDLSLEELKENPNKLNEVSGILLGILGGLFGVGLIFGRNLIRLGIKKVYLSKLKNNADQFKEKILEKTSEVAKNSAELRKTIMQKQIKLKQEINNSNIQGEIGALKKQKKQIDKTLSKDLNDFITKYTTSKTKEVHQKIDELKRLKDSQKLALKTFWDSLMPNIRIEAFKKMIEDGIITDIGTLNTIRNEFSNKEKETKKKLISIQNDLKKDIKSKEEEKTQIKQETKYSQKTDRPIQKILKKEDNL